MVTPKDAIIGENIKKARMGGATYLHRIATGATIGMTTAQLASKMQRRGFNWTQSVVYNVERGKRAIHATELISVADALGVTIETLLEGIKLPVARDE